MFRFSGLFNTRKATAGLMGLYQEGVRILLGVYYLVVGS